MNLKVLFPWFSVSLKPAFPGKAGIKRALILLCIEGDSNSLRRNSNPAVMNRLGSDFSGKSLRGKDMVNVYTPVVLIILSLREAHSRRKIDLNPALRGGKIMQRLL